MIEVCKQEQLAHQSVFAEGLRLWLVGDEDDRCSPSGEAAASIVGETFLMWRSWLKSKFEKK